METPVQLRRWTYVPANAGFAAAVCAATATIGAIYLCRFPGFLFLGDGWIFLQYAKNIALGHGWSFNAGEISFGATSPLWTLLLAAVYRISPSYFEPLSCALGLILYCFAMAGLFLTLSNVASNRASALPLVGIAAIALIPFSGLFYAISAMETGLYLFLFALVIGVVVGRPEGLIRDFTLGALSGALFLTRPEAILCAAVYLAVEWNRPGRLARAVAVGCGVLIVAGPWELFMILKSGHALPTSGNGRLYRYIKAIFPDLTIREYLTTSIAGRVLLIPTVIRTQFFAHPVVLVFCLLPYLATCTGFAVELATRRASRLSLFVTCYCTAILGIYLLFQPLLFQRYFVTFLPCAVLFAVARIQVVGHRALIFAWAVVGLSVVVLNMLAVGYYQWHIDLDAETIRLVQAARPAGGQPCRIAAEPLGYAGYFTPCYVIDLGGLINPDIWQYWIDGKGDLQYALDKRADFILANTGLPSDQFSAIHRERDRVLYVVKGAGPRTLR